MFFRSLKVLILSCLMVPVLSQAAVVLEKTRIVFAPGAREASIKLKNPQDFPAMLQAWVTDINNSDKIPFAVNPPASMVIAKGQQILKLIYQGGGNLPADRESMFWMSIQDIPLVPADKAGDNFVAPTFTQKIKVFFRPEGLKADDAAEAWLKLKWDIANKNGTYTLNVSNPTPFHINLIGAGVNAFELVNKDRQIETLKPFESLSIPLATKTKFSGSVSSLVYVVRNDFGADLLYAAKVTNNQVGRFEQVIAKTRANSLPTQQQ